MLLCSACNHRFCTHKGLVRCITTIEQFSLQSCELNCYLMLSGKWRMQLCVTVNAIIAFPNAENPEIHTVNQYRSELTISHCDLFECLLDASCRAVLHSAYSEHWSNHYVLLWSYKDCVAFPYYLAFLYCTL